MWHLPQDRQARLCQALLEVPSFLHWLRHALRQLPDAESNGSHHRRVMVQIWLFRDATCLAGGNLRCALARRAARGSRLASPPLRVDCSEYRLFTCGVLSRRFLLGVLRCFALAGALLRRVPLQRGLCNVPSPARCLSVSPRPSHGHQSTQARAREHVFLALFVRSLSQKSSLNAESLYRCLTVSLWLLWSRFITTLRECISSVS